jgi:hypothetical protein
MASQLKVDTLTGVTTAGSIVVTGEGNSTTTNLQQGLAKAWIRFNGSGTIAVIDSFNIASITDNGTGDYTNTFTNAMINNDYLFGGFSTGTSDGDYARIFTPRVNGSDIDASTTAYRGRSHQSWTGTAEDNPIVSSLTHGDLA